MLGAEWLATAAITVVAGVLLLPKREAGGRKSPAARANSGHDLAGAPQARLATEPQPSARRRGPSVVRVDVSRWTNPVICVQATDGSYPRRVSLAARAAIVEGGFEELTRLSQAELDSEARRLRYIVGSPSQPQGSEVAAARLQQVDLLLQTRQVYGDDCAIEVTGAAQGFAEKTGAEVQQAPVPLERTDPRPATRRLPPPSEEPIDIKPETVEVRR